jgi:hypothetical protein
MKPLYARVSMPMNWRQCQRFSDIPLCAGFAVPDGRQQEDDRLLERNPAAEHHDGLMRESL